MNKFKKGDKVLVVNKDYLKGKVVSYDFQSKTYDILCKKKIINTLERNLRSSIFLLDTKPKKQKRKIVLKKFNMYTTFKKSMNKMSIIVGGKNTDRNAIIKDILYSTRSIPRVFVFSEDDNFDEQKSFFQQYMPSTVISKFNQKNIEDILRKNYDLTIVLDNVNRSNLSHIINRNRRFFNGSYGKVNVIISNEHNDSIPYNITPNVNTHYIITSILDGYDRMCNRIYLENLIENLAYCSKSDVYKTELSPKVQEINDTNAEFYNGMYESDRSLDNEEIKSIFNKCKYIVVDKTDKKFVVDTCFCYEAKPGRKFKVGSREMWKEYDNAVIIQCFFRVSYSKKKAYELRSIPDNLFDPEFSSMRKKLLDIDDSCFK